VEPEKFILFSAFLLGGFLIRAISRGHPLVLWMSMGFLIPYQKEKELIYTLLLEISE